LATGSLSTIIIVVGHYGLLHVENIWYPRPACPFSFNACRLVNVRLYESPSVRCNICNGIDPAFLSRPGVVRQTTSTWSVVECAQLLIGSGVLACFFGQSVHISCPSITCGASYKVHAPTARWSDPFVTCFTHAC